MRKEKPGDRESAPIFDRRFIESMVDSGHWLEGQFTRMQIPRPETSKLCLEFNAQVARRKKAGENVSPEESAVEFLNEARRKRSEEAF